MDLLFLLYGKSGIGIAVPVDGSRCVIILVLIILKVVNDMKKSILILWVMLLVSGIVDTLIASIRYIQSSRV